MPPPVAGVDREPDDRGRAIGAWTGGRNVADVLDVLNRAAVPAGRIYTAKDIAEDPHYRARGMIQTVTTGDGLQLEVPGIVPKLSLTPGAITSCAPTLGQHSPVFSPTAAPEDL